MVNLTSFLMIYTFIKLSLIIKELEANEISTLKNLWRVLKYSVVKFDSYQLNGLFRLFISQLKHQLDT